MTPKNETTISYCCMADRKYPSGIGKMSCKKKLSKREIK